MPTPTTLSPSRDYTESFTSTESFSSANCLILGAGQVGKLLAQQLSMRGHQVTAVRRRRTPEDEGASLPRFPHLPRLRDLSHLRWIYGDISDGRLYEQLFRQLGAVDVIFVTATPGLRRPTAGYAAPKDRREHRREHRREYR